MEQDQSDHWELTDEGKEFVEKGSHEARLFNAIDQAKGTLQSTLMVRWLAQCHMTAVPNNIVLSCASHMIIIRPVLQ